MSEWCTWTSPRTSTPCVATWSRRPRRAATSSSRPPSGADLSQAALFSDAEPEAQPEPEAKVEPEEQAEDPDTILDADEAADEAAAGSTEAAPSEEPEEKPASQPAASDGEAYAPRTDADIDGASSLFDL